MEPNKISNIPSGLALIVVLSLPLILLAQVREGPGSIDGTVTDEFGQPVKHARVEAFSLQGEKMITGFDTHTDDSGSFRYQHLALGDFGLYAANLETGYRDTNDPCSERRLVRVKLTAEEPEGHTLLKFASKAGSLTGWVTDADTSEHLDAMLKISMGHCLETTGVSSRYKFHHLVPADTEITLEVTAKGYKSWVYPDSSSPSQPLKFRLQSGTELEVNPQLEREKSSDGQR